MNPLVEGKIQELADSLNGTVVSEPTGLAVCIKGSINGLPATLQAVHPGWPFGVMFIVETRENAAQSQGGSRVTVCPRMGRGLASILTFLFLFEGKSMPVGDSQLEGEFNFTYEDPEIAHRLVSMPGVPEQIRQLESRCHFSELIVRTDAGLYMAQPKSLEALDIDECHETFVQLADLAAKLAKYFK